MLIDQIHQRYFDVKITKNQVTSARMHGHTDTSKCPPTLLLPAQPIVPGAPHTITLASEIDCEKLDVSCLLITTVFSSAAHSSPSVGL